MALNKVNKLEFQVKNCVLFYLKNDFLKDTPGVLFFLNEFRGIHFQC